jgi:cell division protein FtsW (lipid II flippase)
MALAFLCRTYLVMIMSLARRGDRFGLIDLFYANRSAMALGALAALPAIAVIIASVQRSPTAGSQTRWLWRNGRWFLLGSALANLAIALLPIKDGLYALSTLDVLQFSVISYILVYLFRSERVRDTFADFPAPPPPEDQEEDLPDPFDY